jgi:hypothetical protein
MAINFPPPPGDKGDLIDGDYYTDSESGRQWQYDASIDAWRAAGDVGPGIVYRGPINLNVDPATQYSNIESGNLFAVTNGTANVDQSLYPGLSGQILAPAELIYGGNPGVWSIISGSVPYATETTPGRIQIATEGEVTTGTDATKAVVPAYLKTVIDAIDIPDELPSGGSEGQFLGHGLNDPEWKDLPNASASKAGITEYATEAEVNEGSSELLAVTPKSLGTIKSDITNNATDITTNATNIAINTTNISNLDAKIDNHIGNLSYPDSDGYYPVGSIGCFRYSPFNSLKDVNVGDQTTIGSDGVLNKISLDNGYSESNEPRENEKWVALTPAVLATPALWMRIS